jgi:hypothetical protein
MRVPRSQVLAYRVAVQGLHRHASSIDDMAVLHIGVQEAMGHPAALAFAARLASDVDVSPDAVEVGPGTGRVLTWSLRGAPHVHPRDEMDALAGALYPLSEADATARLNETGPSVQRAGISALDQFRSAVTELRAVVTKPTAKGAASTAVSARLPKAMLRDCRACKASHLSDSAMRTAALAAGLEFQPATSPPVLVRRRGAKLPKRADAGALAGLARAYLTLLGPATLADVAGYVEGRRADVEEALRDRLPDLVDVDVDGRATLLPAEQVAALRQAPDPDVVRLLGAFDPYMQARDRDLLVPDRAAQKALWPVLGRPGVLLVDGEIAGTWRTKSSGRKLTITVEMFAALPASRRKELDGEAQRVAEVRGVADVTVRVS